MVEPSHITANKTNPVYLVFPRQPSVLPVADYVMQEVAMTVFRLLVYLGDTNLNNLNPPSERAMGYRGFHCISVDKLSFLIQPSR